MKPRRRFLLGEGSKVELESVTSKLIRERKSVEMSIYD